MLTEVPQPIHLKDYQPPGFLIDRVDLAFDLGEERTAVHARLTVRRNPDAPPGDGALCLNGEQLELQSVSLDGRPLNPDAYALDEESLQIRGLPDAFVLETRVHIRPQNNSALEGLYKSGGMFCTQCEAEGFRRITYFLDRPDVMSRFSTSITADRSRYPVLLSNGNPVETEDSATDGIASPGRIPTQSPVTCSHWSPVICAISRIPIPRLREERWHCVSMWSPPISINVITPCAP